jgi:hypothetical protein
LTVAAEWPLAHIPGRSDGGTGDEIVFEFLPAIPKLNYSKNIQFSYILADTEWFGG